MSQTLGSLRKALRLIDELAYEGGSLGVSELGRRLGLAKNQVFRILKTLEEFDYVHQNSDKTYALSYKFSEIGVHVLSRSGLAEQAAPLMASLRDQTGETVNLFIRDGLHAVCIAQRESRASVRMSAQVGRRFLPHAGACPKTIFAFQPPAVVAAAIERYGLPRYTPTTITDPETLAQHFELIRSRGYAESDEDIDIHAYSVGVPIYDREGQVSSAMSVAGPAFRFVRELRSEALTQLLEGTKRLNATRGFLPLQTADMEGGQAARQEDDR